MDPQKNTYWKFVRRFLGIMLLGFAIFLAVGFFVVRQRERGVENLARSLEEIQRDQYERAMADTYGGKTPQETLRLYIEAVEAGDYELASRYFVVGGQEKELSSLQNSPKENVDKVVNLLKENLKSPGSFSAEKDGYTIRKPLLVDFILYPNGIWKITEI